MKPYFAAPDGQQIFVGDVRDVLRELPDESVQCVVTSPPYWGLRDYGTAEWEGGSAECEHVEMAVGMSDKNSLGPNGHLPETNAANVGRKQFYRDTCRRCGARRIDRQIGLEPTPAAYVETMVEVFREVRRVLRSDGTCWLNLGDSYATNQAGNKTWGDGVGTNKHYQNGDTGLPERSIPADLKPKDLIGIPWRVALALQADGWYLRSDIIWAKRAPMPESVTDRPTSAQEHVFLLSKRATYFYDAAAVAEKAEQEDRVRCDQIGGDKGSDVHHSPGAMFNGSAMRNLRNVWLLGPEPYPEAHFATFPTEIPRRAILAGTSEAGCCPKCGKPWVRVMSERPIHGAAGVDYKDNGSGRGARSFKSGSDYAAWCALHPTTHLGFRAACKCDAGAPVPQTILDPFLGSGTSLLVARQLGRKGLGIELNPKYADLAVDRLEGQTLSLFALEVS